MSLLLSLFANSGDRRAALRLVKRASCVSLLLLFLCAGSAQAIPLEEYKARIQQALIALDELWEEEEAEIPTDYRARSGAVLDRVKALVPPEETIEWEGGRVRVNNSWLGEELKKYRLVPADDTQRWETLMRIRERLSALENRLDELSAQGAASTTKEEEKARLEAILRRDEYNDKPPEKSTLARLWDRIREWWNNLFRGMNPLQPGRMSWLSFIAMVLVFGLAAGVLGYVVWKYTPLFGGWRGARLKPTKRGARVVLGERLEADKTAADLLAEAETLARKGELRAAIRKGYIALLCELGDRKVIELAQHKTNHDYLRAVREKRPLLNEMQKLTASFENHWYGYAPATPNDWTNFRSGYQQTLKTATLLSDE